MSPCPTYLQTLRQRGYRITPQREMIIEAFAHSLAHLTAEDLYTQVHQRSRAINIATVYRTLDLLVENGLATRSGTQDDRILYANAHHGPHVHLVCRVCGKAINADYTLFLPLGGQLLAEYQFQADLNHMTIVGLCEACRVQSFQNV